MLLDSVGTGSWLVGWLIII